MISTQQLDDLIHSCRRRGAVIEIEYDAEAMRTEGRRIYESVRVVSGLPGVGPFPMSAIGAGEALRPAYHRALHGLCRHGKDVRFCSKQHNGGTQQ